MHVLKITNFNVKENKLKDLQQFVIDNEKTLAAHAPKGWTYQGTYFYVLGFGDYHCAVFWELNDYAAFDAFRDHEDPVFWDLIEQKLAFMTPEPNPAWLLRKVSDTKLTEPKE